LASIKHSPAPVSETVAPEIAHAPVALDKSIEKVTALPDAPPVAVTV
jgi:hypothetical protein